MGLRGRKRRLVAAIQVAALAAGSPLAGLGARHVLAASPGSPWGTRVRLARAVFDPTGGSPSPPKALAPVAAAASHRPSSSAGTGDLWLVQLQVPVAKETLTQLSGSALRPLAVVPDATYLMRGTQVAADAVHRLRGVRAVTPFPLWLKLAPGVEQAAPGSLLRLTIFPDSDAVQVASALRAAGVAVEPAAATRVLTVRAGGPAVLAAIVAEPGVAGVAVKTQMRPMNAVARWVTQSAERGVTPVTDHGLLGQGEVATVADTGLNYFPDSNGMANEQVSDCTDPKHPSASTCKLADITYQAPDVAPGGAKCSGSGDYVNGTYAKNATSHRKVLAYFNDVALCAAVAGDSGPTTHGSHVSGSVAGDSPPYGVVNGNDGMAPAAKLEIQDIGDDNESLAGLGGDFYNLLSQAYDPGRAPSPTRGSGGAATPADTVGPYARGTAARVHSESFGSAVPVVGTGESTRADDFVANNEDMAVVVAAGNSGPDQASVGEPGTAKDVITSGAEDAGNTDFASIDTLANFSSHGDALDFGMLPNLHHIKPDVVDPGARIVSMKGGTNTDQMVLQGTSMSTPVLSGNTLLVRQYFEDGFGPTGPQGAVTGLAQGRKGATAGFNPSAALVKAVLVNSGQRMLGQYTGTQGSQRSMDGQWPSLGQGWGRVELDRALHFSDVTGSPDLWVQDTEYCPPPQHCSAATGHGVTTGEDKTYSLQVGAGQPLKVILAWSDPGGVSSVVGLGPEDVTTNQLALQVDAPDGTHYCSNNINSMMSPSSLVATSLPGACNPLTDDKFNNVHGVYLPNPAPGTYTIHVIGDLVMQNQNVIGLTVPPGGGRQGYALAATGRFTDVAAAVSPAPAAPAITGASVTSPSGDLAIVRFTTNVPTTATVTLTPDFGSPVTLADVYSRPGSSYTGLALTLVENDGAFLNRLVRGTEHVVKFTGLSPATHYAVRYTATGVPPGVTALSPAASGPSGPSISGSLSVTTPNLVFAPTVGADTTTLYNANTTVGPPIPDVTGHPWGESSQLYVGTLTATTDVVCRVAQVQLCPSLQAGSGFKFRLPAGMQASNITGAAVLLFTRHDLTSHVLGTPTHQLALLADSAEGKWGPGTRYNDVYSAPVDALVGAPTDYRSVVYDTEAFTFSCNDLPKLIANLRDGQAAFRLQAGGNPGMAKSGGALGESVYAWETGYGRRTSGVEYRPRLVLFSGTGDPLRQAATAAPTVSDVRTERADATTAIVHWRTDQPSDSIVLLRQGASGDIVQVGSPAFVTEHHVTVTGVGKGESWQFGLRSTAPDGRATTATNGGSGWAITDAATVPPGPASAVAAGKFDAAGVVSESLASPAGVAHATGRACPPQTLAVGVAAPGGRTATPTIPATGPGSPARTGTGTGLIVVALVLAALAALARPRTGNR